jgi:hypothetical protein
MRVGAVIVERVAHSRWTLETSTSLVVAQCTKQAEVEAKADTKMRTFRSSFSLNLNLQPSPNWRTFSASC